MQVKDIFTEICSRAGEGYQNYLDRAVAHFKTAIISALYASPRPDIDAPFLYRKGRFNPYNAEDIFRISLYDLFSMAGLTEGKIHLLKYCPDRTAVVVMDKVPPDAVISFYAKEPGEQGNDIFIEYVDSGVDNELIIEVYDKDPPAIRITLERYSNDFITTANDLLKTLPKTEAWRYITATIDRWASGEEILTPQDGMTSGGTGTGEFLPMEVISEQQSDAVRLRPSLRQTGKSMVLYYTLSGQGENAYINILPNAWFDEYGTIEFAVIGWDGNVIKKDGTTDNVEAMFSPAFLDMSMTVAAELLRNEIQA